VGIRAVGKPWEASPAAANGGHGPPRWALESPYRDAGIHYRSAECVRIAGDRPGQAAADGLDKTKVGGSALDAEDEDA